MTARGDPAAAGRRARARHDSAPPGRSAMRHGRSPEAAASAETRARPRSRPRSRRRRVSRSVVSAPARASDERRRVARLGDQGDVGARDRPPCRCRRRLRTGSARELLREPDRRRARDRAPTRRRRSPAARRDDARPGGSARMLRTRSCSSDGQQAAARRACPRVAPGVRVAQPADLHVRAGGELDEAAAEPRGLADRLELTRRQAAAGRAHARQPAILRRLQGEHAGAAVVAPPACSLRAVVDDAVGAQFAVPLPAVSRLRALVRSPSGAAGSSGPP